MEPAAQVLWLVLLAAVFYLLLIRPQRRRQQEVLGVQRSVEVGSEVMTTAGFFGRVTATVDDPAAGDCLLLEIAPGVELKIARGAVMRVVEPVDETPDPDPAPETPDTPTNDDRSS